MRRIASRDGGHWPLIRIWTEGDWPVGSAPSGGIAVEWAGGQPGHPTSYALVGGASTKQGVTINVTAEGEFSEALAGVADYVVFGLPEPYAKEVDNVLAERLDRGFVVTMAAHGRSGSSEMAFRFVARFLCEVLKVSDLSALTDEQLWDLWGSAARPDS